MIKADTRELIRWKKKLQSASRGAYPLSVRGTVNTLAFKTTKIAKKRTLKQKFTLRNKYIQKTVSASRSKDTFIISKMESKAGQLAKFAGKETTQLKKQEFGGTDRPRRKYVKTALASARVGNTMKKKVRSGNRISNLNKIGNMPNISDFKPKGGGSKNQQFIAHIARKARKGELPKTGTMIMESKKGNKIMAKYMLLKRPKKVGDKGSVRSLKITPLYVLKKSRVNKPQPWLKPASDIAHSGVNKIYVKEAQRQWKRLMKKRG